MKNLTAVFPTVAALAAVSLWISCGMTTDPNELYQRGVKEARAQQWDPAIDDLESFARKACVGARPDQRCRKAQLALARGYEHRGAAARAWVALDAALALPPHDDDAAARDDLARMEQKLRDKQVAAGGHGPVMVRYRDEMTDEFTARSVLVTIDFNPVHTRNRGAADLRGPDFTQLWSGTLPAGDHVLVVEAAHSCKPGVAAHCSGSQVHRSWSFTSEAHTPTGLDVRAFADAPEGSSASSASGASGKSSDTGAIRATLEMRPH